MMFISLDEIKEQRFIIGDMYVIIKDSEIKSFIKLVIILKTIINIKGDNNIIGGIIIRGW